MAATGLKKGGIYRHFSSKEELAALGVRLHMGGCMERSFVACEREDGW
jgi:AcrR family transcriptional regulator